MKSSYLSFEDGMILYLKDPKESIRKLADLINTYSHVAREKKAAYIKSVAFIPLMNLLMKKLGKTDHSQWLQKKSNSQE